MRKLFIPLMLMLPIAASAQKSYTISGQISGLKTPAKVYLATVQGNAYKDTDSAEVKNGKFTFSGSVDAPQQALLNLRRSNPSKGSTGRDQLALFLENSKISIKAKDSLKNGIISGSVSDKERSELDNMTSPLSATIIRLNDEYGKKPASEARTKAADSVTKLVARIYDINYNFAKSHLNSFMGLYVYHNSVLNSKFDPAKVGPLFDQFSPELKSSALGRRTVEKIEAAKRRQAGVKATDFTQTDLNDQPFKLSSLRGKYVLVDFWASWCVPCRAENPNLVKAYAALKDKNFEVVGVSLDEGKVAWAAAVKKDNLPWIHVSDLKGWKNEVATLYGINSVPQNILINPEGVIVAKNLRGEDLTEKLSAFIK